MDAQNNAQFGSQSGVQQQQAQSQFQPPRQATPADPLISGTSEDIRQVARLGYN